MKKKITPKVSENFEVGTILVNSWGWEQTNIDFFCIVERKGQYVTVLPMKKAESNEIGFMTNDVTPLEIINEAKPRRKKIMIYDGKESGFSFGNYSGAGYCKPWNGKPERESHYA